MTLSHSSGIFGSLGVGCMDQGDVSREATEAPNPTDAKTNRAANDSPHHSSTTAVYHVLLRLTCSEPPLPST